MNFNFSISALPLSLLLGINTYLETGEESLINEGHTEVYLVEYATIELFLFILMVSIEFPIKKTRL